MDGPSAHLIEVVTRQKVGVQTGYAAGISTNKRSLPTPAGRFTQHGRAQQSAPGFEVARITTYTLTLQLVVLLYNQLLGNVERCRATFDRTVVGISVLATGGQGMASISRSLQPSAVQVLAAHPLHCFHRLSASLVLASALPCLLTVHPRRHLPRPTA